MIIMIFLVFTSMIEAKEMTLEEAIHWGIEHNYDLQVIRHNIESIENQLKILDANEAWQVNLDVKPIWYFGNEDTDEDKSQITLEATKILPGNFNISTEVSSQDFNFKQLSFEEIAKNFNATTTIGKQLYPEFCSQNDKEIYSTKNSLKQKTEELTWQEIETQITFIEDYLTIARLEEEVTFNEQKYNLALENFNLIERQISLGEGGYQQESESKLALEESKNDLFSLKQNLDQQKQQWYLQLALPEDTQVKFTEDPSYLDQLKTQMNQLGLQDKGQDELLSLAAENDYQLKINHMEREELLQEAVWTENEGKPTIEVSAGYTIPSQLWGVMAELSANLSDGGAQKLKEEQAQASIAQKDLTIEQYTEELKLKVKQLVDQDNYNQAYLQTKSLALEKEENKREIMEKQYQGGAISSTDWQEELITLGEKEVELKKAEDQLLVNRLRLAHYIGILKKER